MDIIQTLGFPEDALPFRYLGVPPATKKLSIIQCWPLVEKITSKINCWSSKLLSYAGRLQLIKSVLFGVQSYWSQIFLLPKQVMKMIESLCRSFLWTGTSSISKKALVAWERVCMPQATGGLNVTNLCMWNKAAVTKQLWAIAMKKDCLWIKWIHSFYIKQNDLAQFQIPKTAAWVVRKILGTRDTLLRLQGMSGNLTQRLSQLQQREKFSIKKLYLMMMPQYPRVTWKYMVLQAPVHPRFKFILWLAANKRLATVDRLMKFRLQVPQTCVFCGLADEMFEHLFFDCPYVKTLWTRMLAWYRLVGTWTSEVI